MTHSLLNSLTEDSEAGIAFCVCNAVMCLCGVKGLSVLCVSATAPLSSLLFSSPAVYKHDFTHCSSPSHESRFVRCSYVAVTVTVKGVFHDKTLPAAACTCATARHTHMLGQRVLLHTNARTHAREQHLPVHDVIPNVADFPLFCFSRQPL